MKRELILVSRKNPRLFLTATKFIKTLGFFGNTKNAKQKKAKKN